MNISRHISDLLFENDCVIVPGLGGFVCNYKPAAINPVRHLFTPPSKLVLFNEKLKNNDGLLANQIAVAESIGYEAAIDTIDEFVRETLIAVAGGEKITLENIGVFYADSEGNLQFDPDLSINFNKDSFGLTSFISPAIHRDYRKMLQRPEIKFEDRKSAAYPKRKKSPVGWIIAGVPVVTAIVWIGLNLNVGSNLKNQTGLMPNLTQTEEMTPVKTNPNRFSHLLSDTETPAPATREQTETQHTAPATGEVAYTPSDKMENEVELVPNQPEEVKIAQPADQILQKKYYLIAGSFESLVNAEKLVEQFKNQGFQPELAGQAGNGFYRVAISAFAKKDEALAELKRIRENQNPNVWILKK